MPESSINSWDSWFIFNLLKNKHPLLHDTPVHGKGHEDILLLQVSLRIYQQCNHCDFSDVNFLSNTCNRTGNKLKFLFMISTPLSNVHNWAIFFLKHLANMSCMVPFWASTDYGSVLIWGARVRSHAVRRRLFIVLMIAVVEFWANNLKCWCLKNRLPRNLLTWTLLII